MNTQKYDARPPRLLMLLLGATMLAYTVLLVLLLRWCPDLASHVFGALGVAGFGIIVAALIAETWGNKP